MLQTTGNIWNYHKKGYFIVIPTNGCVKTNGCAVMGRGLALQANEFFGELAIKLGTCLNQLGNDVFLFEEYNLITFPTKDHWSEYSNINLIIKSTQELKNLADILQEENKKEIKIVLPKVGCGCGKLTWNEVKNILCEYLDNRFIIVDRK